MDAGGIYYQKKIAIDPQENFAQLHDKLAEEGAAGMVQTVRKIIAGQINATQQDHAQATYTQKTEKSDTYINWNNSAKALHNFVRAYSPKPCAITFLDEKPLKIVACQITEQKSTSPAGTIAEIAKNQGFLVCTQDFDILVTKVLPAGKKEMDAYAFSLGKTDLLAKKFGNPQ